MLLKIFLFLSIPIAVGLVISVRSKFNDNQKKYLLYGLWVFILIFSYLTYSSISEVMSFDKVKNYRYQSVIKNLKDQSDLKNPRLSHDLPPRRASGATSHPMCSETTRKPSRCGEELLATMRRTGQCLVAGHQPRSSSRLSERMPGDREGEGARE